jgi:hypothetical protein
MNIIKKVLKKLIINQIVKIEVRFYNFKGEPETGYIEVNKSIKKETKNVFDKLYQKRFIINNVTVSNKRSDKEIILENDSTSFNFRTVLGKNRLSKHSFGYAIDINPKNNPAKPSEMFDIYDTTIREGIIEENTIDIFKENGFRWGGEIFKGFWDSHHFEIEMNSYNKIIKYIWEF